MKFFGNLLEGQRNKRVCDFFRFLNLIPQNGRNCSGKNGNTCGARMRVENDRTMKIDFRWRCTIACKASANPLAETFFEYSNLSFVDLRLMFCFTENLTVTDAMRHTGHGPNTVVARYQYLRAVCDRILDEEQEQVGGQGLHVEIDETHLFENKYHQGRPTAMQARREYVFGMLCRETKTVVMIRVKKCDKATLWPLILRYVRPGSIIYTDGAKVYGNLCRSDGRAYGFNFHSHKVVIHKNGEYVRREGDEVVTTNNLEVRWRYLKDKVASVPEDQKLDDYISYYVYFDLHLKDREPGARLRYFLNDIRRVYPGVIQ